ncbi:hypothetical protein [Oceanivirga salmonicida]|uniref:hypothetical protein n=1 Tax=Oceanivirga salmonicida TaxID=1769291 RepID=UPI0012E2BB44|nr:hypothetical protein [Oceanivirga salmonicida]
MKKLLLISFIITTVSFANLNGENKTYINDNTVQYQEIVPYGATGKKIGGIVGESIGNLNGNSNLGSNAGKKIGETLGDKIEDHVVKPIVKNVVKPITDKIKRIF